MKKEEKKYETPSLTVVTFKNERGYEASGGGGKQSQQSSDDGNDNENGISGGYF